MYMYGMYIIVLQIREDLRPFTKSCDDDVNGRSLSWLPVIIKASQNPELIADITAKNDSEMVCNCKSVIHVHEKYGSNLNKLLFCSFFELLVMRKCCKNAEPCVSRTDKKPSNLCNAFTTPKRGLPSKTSSWQLPIDYSQINYSHVSI